MEPFTSLLIESNKKMFQYEKYVPDYIMNANKISSRGNEKHYSICVFYKEKPKINKEKPKINMDFTKIKIDENKNANNSTDFSLDAINNLTANKRTCDIDSLIIHPTQKSAEFLKTWIERYTNEGDVVLDPFMGSGSTAAACLELNRLFIGFEKDAEFHKKSLIRIEKCIAVKKGVF